MGAPKLTTEHINSVRKYIEFLCMYYNLEESRVRATLIVGNAEKETDIGVSDYLDYLAKKGFHITTTKALVSIDSLL